MADRRFGDLPATSPTPGLPNSPGAADSARFTGDLKRDLQEAGYCPGSVPTSSRLDFAPGAKLILRTSRIPPFFKVPSAIS